MTLLNRLNEEIEKVKPQGKVVDIPVDVTNFMCQSNSCKNSNRRVMLTFGRKRTMSEKSIDEVVCDLCGTIYRHTFM